MPLCLGFRHASVDYRLIEDSFGPACIHSTPAAEFFSCSKGQIRLGLVGTEERGTRRLHWFAGCQRLQLYHSDEGSPPLLTLAVLSTVKLGRPKLTVDNIQATLVTVDRPHLGRCHNMAVVDQQMSRQDVLGCRLVPPHSLHPLLCSRDIYAVSDHLWRYPVLGRRLSHRPSKPNDLNRGFLWYKQSATQPVCFCLGITIPHTTASSIDCRRGSVEQQPV